MKHVFVLVDCSGSIVADETEKIGQLNDLLHDLTTDLEQGSPKKVYVICYAKTAQIYWQSGQGFMDLDEGAFSGLSNLGQAYTFVKKIVDAEKISPKSCVVALISDGSATDNYREKLSILDGKNQMARVALTIGTINATTEYHAPLEGCAFRDGINDRDDFIEKIIDLAEN